jgi:hypothetical protein
MGDRYSSDKPTAQKSLEIQVQFVLDNLKWLRKVDKNGFYEKRIEELKHRVFTKTMLYPKEKKTIDDAVELVYRGYGWKDAKVTAFVKRRKGLRF